ncbi:MAG: NAD(P)H-dependent glycerol-3-phosphate dehydrogenase [Cytophagaceae bacterium]|nr:NAD(P)H-dependent glycerol-3-phosphate dehydrogenase [Cytophagaceae bacterium]
MSTSSTPVPTQIAIVGGGSWATALVKILSEHDVRIRWWLRNRKDLDHIRTFHHNPSYLSDVHLNPRRVKPCAKLPEAVRGADYVILAVPGAFLRDTLQPLKAADFTGKTIVSAIKGMIPGDNLLVTDWVEKEYRVDPQQLCVIAGPCHAEEVALEKQSYLTIASPNLETANRFAKLMTCRYVASQGISDLYGVEYCAVLKNIVALACGVCHGLGYGDNFQAVLVSNAMQEIKRFLDAVYPFYRDLAGSAYLGDLLVTAYSQFSRNRTFGSMIGRGYSVQSAQMELNMIAEGYYAVKSISEINRQFEVDMPITDAVYNILYQRSSPGVEMGILKNLMR